ncbi:hypothetical protein TNCT_74281 [Trichonephila clavata]|uniref:Uncharacterized protein n=1 Tax=Trichonephila clavata TaxID=2740835 RepID=A0A8X6GC53_TRICU|nr:hypothetical protein TNCT_74281 [Trichonephila clavata]
MVDMSFQKPCGSSKVINPSTFGTNGSIACCEIGERSFTCPQWKNLQQLLWTDSTIALSWIQGPSGRWKVFRRQPCKGDTISNRQGFVASLSWKRQTHRSSHERHQC